MIYQWYQILPLLLTGTYLAINVDAENILAMYPVGAKSHWLAHKPLYLELTKRGHNITLVTSFIEKDWPANWEIIQVRDILSAHIGGTSTLAIASRGRGFWLYNFLLEFGIKACDDILKEEPFQNLINMKEKKFDIFMMDYFNHNCLLAFAYKFGIPIIGISCSGGLSWEFDAFGDPLPLSYAPDIVTDYTDHMTFWQRLTNVFTVTYARFVYYWLYIPKSDAIVRKYFKDESIPSIATLEANASLLIVQSHPSFSYPRPHLPNVIETGGMRAQRPPNIPKDLQIIMDDAKDGVIFFSMGSVVKSSDFPDDIIQAFVSVFGKLKQLVLWKWDKENIQGLPRNVRLSKWYPQSDLLAHKNVKLFISHGGLQSLTEATSRGVPIIGIPVMAEQVHNVRMAIAAGYAVKLEIGNITTQSLEWAIAEVLNNPSYQENAKLRSRLFHDRPQSAVDTAVYWTEYVLRHRGASHLRSAARDLAWYQLLLLDVIAVLLLGVVVVALVAYLFIKKIYTALTCRLSPSNRKKKTTKKE